MSRRLPVSRQAGGRLAKLWDGATPDGTWQFCPGAAPHTVRAARMRAEYPSADGVRLCRRCDDGACDGGSGRLFACRGCGCDVIVCRRCDRGQVYCAGDCSAQARRQTLRRAGRRWQRTRRGRLTHAAATARYRARRASDGRAVALPVADGPIKRVTHHGSPLPAPGDLLAGSATAMPRDDAFPAEPSEQALTHCHWCGRCCLPPLRSGFLRRRDHRRGRDDHARRERRPP